MCWIACDHRIQHRHHILCQAVLENAAVGNALTKDYNPIITYLPVYPLKTLVAASVTLSAVLGAIAFLAHDWMWLIIDILCIALLLLPSSKSLGYNYNRELVKMSMLAPILAVSSIWRTSRSRWRARSSGR